jgi:hypothetical protein
MPRQITSGASFWVRLRGEELTGDGSGDDAQNPLTYEQANSDIGQVGDQPASADSGSFSLLSLFQRLLQRVTLVYKDVPSNGTAVKVAIVEGGEGGGGAVSVSNFPATQSVSGSVDVTNHPTEIEVSNFPATQPVSGSVDVTNHPTEIEVSNFPATQPVSGSVSVTNPVTSVAVSNLPATQPVSGTVAVSNQPTSIEVSNLPVTQAISGAVTVSNFPATQPVSGSVSVSNLPPVGAGTAAAAQRTTLANDSPGVSNLAAVGLTADAAATTDTGGFSLVALFKRSLLRLSNIYAVLCTGTRSGGGPANNAVISGTIAAPPTGQYIHFTGYSFSFSDNPGAARTLTITAGGATLADIDVTTGGAGPVSISVSAPANTAVTFSLAASGTAGNVGKLSLYHTTLSVI